MRFPATLLCALALIWPANALAMDAGDFLARLNALLAPHGGQVSVRSTARLPDGAIRLEGVKIAPRDKAVPAAIARAIIEGAQIEGEVVKADRVSFEGLTAERRDGAGSVTIASGSISGLTVDREMLGGASVTELTDIVVEEQGSRTSIASVTLRRNDPAPGQPMRFSLAIPSIVVEAPQISPEGFDALALLGAEKVELSFSAEMEGDVAANTLSVGPVALAISGVGTFRLQAELEGYGPQQAATLMRRPTRDADAPALAAMAAQRRETLDALRIVSASLKFEDAGLGEKIVSTQGEAMGVEPAEAPAVFAGMAHAALVEMLGQENAEALRKELAAFLADPGSLELRLSPEQAQSIATLVETALSEPGKLVQMLGATVAANR